MARQKKEDPPKAGAPAWTSTFSDLMNLLLCFFVLLFAMSTVESEKAELVIQSFQQRFSVLPAGGTSVSKEGNLMLSLIHQLVKRVIRITPVITVRQIRPIMVSREPSQVTMVSPKTVLQELMPMKAVIRKRK